MHPPSRVRGARWNEFPEILNHADGPKKFLCYNPALFSRQPKERVTPHMGDFDIPLFSTLPLFLARAFLAVQNNEQQQALPP